MLSIPSNLSSTVQQAMDLIITTVGQTCTLYYPPIQSAVLNPQLTPVGGETLDLYSAGTNYPIQYGQTDPLEFGQDFIDVEISEQITMAIQWLPNRFDQKFPGGNRYQDGPILTHGFVSDLQKVQNCDYMETYKDVGFNHYRFKLMGEPTIPDQLVRARYFFAWWDRM